MGKLLSGRYGHEPNAESVALTLKECNQKLNLKPSDFVSEGPPAFFKKSFGSFGKYLLFLVDPEEVADNPIWRPGYYLLPLSAADVLEALERHKHAGLAAGDKLPIEWEVDEEQAEPPTLIKDRALKWASDAQPLFFICGCPNLLLRMDPPWALRRRWRARLRCPRRCQPTLTKLF